MPNAATRSRLLAIALTALLLAALPADAAGLRRFGGWAVGCDNTRHCRAIGWAKALHPDDPTFLIIEREAGPEGRTRISGGGGFAPDKDVYIDGRPVLKLEADIFFASMDPFDIDVVAPIALGVTDAASNSKLIDAALQGASLSFAAAAGLEALIPLDGLRRALLFMDEEQGRAGTATALVAKGARSASAVPLPVAAPAAIPAVRPQIARKDKAENDAVGEFHRENASRTLCDEKSLGGLWEITPTRITPRQSIYDYYCREEGGRFAKLLYVVDADSPTRVAKAPIEQPDHATGGLRLATDVLIMGGSMDDGNWLHVREGDKSGDCREVLAWRWDGKAFRLTQHLLAPLCPNGVSDAPVIVLWRTRDN